MTNDIYAAPESELEIKQNDEPIIATRWQRFLAAMVDGLLIGGIFFALAMVVMTWQEYQHKATGSDPLFLAISGLAGLIIFLLLNGALLANKGQTIGKRMLKIKIVDLNGEQATVKGHLLKRYGFSMALQYIPVAGPFLSLIDSGFIFSKQKRCAHDYVAGTMVVKCDE